MTIGIDSVLVIRSALVRHGTPLRALVENRVWARRHPSSMIWANEEPAIVFNVENDSISGTGRVRIRCYGGSASDKDARDVYHSMVESMHGTFHQSEHGTLVYMFHDSLTADSVEPDSGYPVVVSLFKFCVS